MKDITKDDLVECIWDTAEFIVTQKNDVLPIEDAKDYGKSVKRIKVGMSTILVGDLTLHSLGFTPYRSKVSE